MKSQNGYPVIETNRTTGPLPRLRKWVIPGANRHVYLRDGSTGFLLIHFALWFHETIQRLDVGVWDEWGWAVRNVRGSSTVISNHASGTAIDLNATRLPRGRALRVLLAPHVIARIVARTAWYRGTIRWGGLFRTTVDAMHWEANASLAACEKRALALLDSPRGKRILAANPGALEAITSGTGFKPTPTTRTRLTIITANLFKDNTEKAADVALLDRQRAHLIGLNEAFRFVALLRAVKNYQPVIEGTGAALNNPILVRNGIPVDASFARKMCDKVGSSPERTATVARYTYAGVRRAHVQTHTNAHIENAGKPRALPRVVQDIAHMKNLTKLVDQLRAEGHKVTVAGDFNWAWTTRAVQWTWSPKSVFKRMGLDVQWAHKTAPKGGSLGRRRIDYIAYDRDLTIESQRIVTGEHSDHRWPEVTFTT